MKTINSFAELARIYGCPVKAKAKMALNSYVTVEAACGKKAAVVWSVLQDRECRGVYGDKGKIILTPAELAGITGYEAGSVIGCLLALCGKGYARPTTDGLAVKAA